MNILSSNSPTFVQLFHRRGRTRVMKRFNIMEEKDNKVDIFSIGGHCCRVHILSLIRITNSKLVAMGESVEALVLSLLTKAN